MSDPNIVACLSEVTRQQSNQTIKESITCLKELKAGVCSAWLPSLEEVITRLEAVNVSLSTVNRSDVDNQPVSVSKLTTIADSVQDLFRGDHGVCMALADKLYISLERFEAAVAGEEFPSREDVQWFAYDSFYLAEALALIMDTPSPELEELRGKLEWIMNIHDSDYVEVAA